jgi:hypothetical protein
MKKMMKSKGMAKGGKRGGAKKKMAKGGMRGGAKKMMRNGGKAMKSKGMAKGGKRGGAMTLAAIRSAAKKKGYKLVKV